MHMYTCQLTRRRRTPFALRLGVYALTVACRPSVSPTTASALWLRIDGLGSATTGGRRADAGHPRRTRTPTDTPGGGGDRPLVILLARRPPRDSRVERHHHLPSGPTRSRVHAFTRSRAHALTRARAHARAHAFTLPLFLPVLGPPDGHHEDSSLSPPNQKRQPPPNQPDTICFELQR